MLVDFAVVVFCRPVFVQIIISGATLQCALNLDEFAPIHIIALKPAA